MSIKTLVGLLLERLPGSWYIEGHCISLEQLATVTERFPDFKLQAPLGHYFADPFIVKRKGERALLFEDYSAWTGRGTISAVGLGDDGKPIGPVHQIVAQSYHLSFPFTFEWRDDLYMLPESCANQTLDLYRCVNFPFEWEFDRTLASNCDLADTVLLRSGDESFLLTSPSGGGGADDRGAIAVFAVDLDADEPILNQISTETRCAGRNGGGTIKFGPDVIRVAQVSGRSYGWALRLNRIEAASIDGYAERALGEIEFKGWLPRNIHTLNYADSMAVIDVKSRAWPHLITGWIVWFTGFVRRLGSRNAVNN